MTTITGLVFRLTTSPLSFTIEDGERDVLCLIQDTPEWTEAARSIFGKIVVVTGALLVHDVLLVEQVEVQAALEDGTP